MDFDEQEIKTKRKKKNFLTQIDEVDNYVEPSFLIPTIIDKENEIEEIHHLKFLVVPSFMAGVFLGTNNFFLGFISELGIAAAFEFSLGALLVTSIVKLVVAIRSKRQTGHFFPYERSNFFRKNEKTGKVSIKWMNVLGIVLRPICNMSF